MNEIFLPVAGLFHKSVVQRMSRGVTRPSKLSSGSFFGLTVGNWGFQRNSIHSLLETKTVTGKKQNADPDRKLPSTLHHRQRIAEHGQRCLNATLISFLARDKLDWVP